MEAVRLCARRSSDRPHRRAVRCACQSFERLVGEVQPVERRVAFFEHGDDAQALRVVIEPFVGRERLVECPFPGMPEGRMAEVMGKRQRLRKVLVEAERPGDGPRDLRHFQRVGQPRAEMVALVVNEDLRLVLQPPERIRMDDAVAVALERRAERIVGLRIDPPAACCRVRRVGRAPALPLPQEILREFCHAPPRLTTGPGVLS
jgi:hypothetical protein